MIGAGGAARAVVLALAEAGASQVAVLNRTPERAAAAAALAGAVGSVGARPEKPPGTRRCASADLVVNATPFGMAGASPEGATAWLVAPELLRAGQVAADLVYVPRPTPGWRGPPRRAPSPSTGSGMLVHQAAAQLVLWTGQGRPSRPCGRRRRRSIPPAPDAAGS